MQQKKALAEKLQEVENGANPEANKTLTFRQLTDKYLKYHAEIYLRESTYDTYTGFLNLHILPVIGDMKVIEITLNTINEYVTIIGPDAVSFQMKALVYEALNDEFNAAVNFGYMKKSAK